MSDTPRRLPPSFKGVASGRTGMRDAARFHNQLADAIARDRRRVCAAGLVGTPPDPDSVGED